MRFNTKHKVIKKLTRIAAVILLIIIGLPAALYFMIQWPAFQTYLTRQIAQQVSVNLNAKFEIGRVDIAFFNRVYLRDIYIEDQQGDTLLKADRLTASIQSFNRSERRIGFNNITIQNARINLLKDADSVLNLKFITDALASDDTSGTKWKYDINSIHLRDAGLRYRFDISRKKRGGINFRDILLNDINLLVNRINIAPDSVSFNIKYLNFNEVSGFSLNHFASFNSISSTGIILEKINIVTPRSKLDLDHFKMSFDDFTNLDDFVNLVNIQSHFNPSLINMSDIAFFAPGIGRYETALTLSGTITGRISSLKGDNVSILGSKETSILTDFNFIGLPDISETFIYLDLLHLNSSVADIEDLYAPGLKNGETGVPPFLSNAGNISYRGKFTGFIDDFVAYGELNTDLGTLITDLSLRPAPNNILNFNGKLRALNFDAGTLGGVDQIGWVTFNAGISGQVSREAVVSATLDGVIDSVLIYDYNYKQIELKGELAERRFEGSAIIDDPNIAMEFLGIIDISAEIPVFDFAAQVNNARLYDLRLEDDEQDLVLSFTSVANFRGNNPDNMNGTITLVDAMFEKEDQHFKINNATLEAAGTGSQRQIIFSSDLADAHLDGRYEFATISESFKHLVANYIPSYSGDREQFTGTERNNFTFKFNLKELLPFTEFFMPHVYIAPETRIEGIYDPAGLNLSTSGFSNEIRIGSHKFSEIDFKARSDDSVFNFLSTIGYILIADRLGLDNLSITTDVMNDSLDFRADWDNNDIISYKGSLYAQAGFSENPGKNTPVTEIVTFPTEITIADSVWRISESRIILDSTSYQIESFIFGRSDQYLRVDGRLSEHLSDSLHIRFRNMSLGNIELFTYIRNFHFAGYLEGSVSISDVHNNPVFKTDLEISSLYLNHQDFGNMSILSQWNSRNRSIDIHTFSDRGPDRIINIEGSYLPEGGDLDFDISLSKINLRTFDGYLNEVFGNLRGLAGGELSLAGNIRQPLFNGNINLQKTTFTIDYLKTQYSFTHDIQIRNNTISFNDLLVYDIDHNTCRANGTIRNRYFRDFNLNIFLYPNRFMALNTRERDNDMFYGRVYGSGLVHITGPANNIQMSISARTDRNTRFFIPLQKSGELEEFDFLNFISNAEADDPTDEQVTLSRHQVNLTGMQLSFDLDVTPEADVQIIFDSKIGDIIRGNGSGSFKMEINTLGQFSLFGEYTIEQGDYLFTLQNVINKRFDIERGGRVFWNGDPFDANIDMKAVYRVRASLNSLMTPFTNGVSDTYARRIPVECHIIMRNKLMNPDISFNIELPTADQDTRRNVQGVLNTEEKVNRQFLSLLVINNFLPAQDLAGPGRGSSLGMSATEASLTTVSEFLSNQLSNWLSQLSRDVDFGINWRPGDEISPDEVELAVSTQLLDDRVSINGHVDVGGRQTNTSNIVGDVDVEVKLNRSGRLRLKAFTRANDNLIRPHLSPYTQGVGLFYREDFDTFGGLIQRYWSKLSSTGSETTD